MLSCTITNNNNNSDVFFELSLRSTLYDLKCALKCILARARARARVCEETASAAQMFSQFGRYGPKLFLTLDTRNGERGQASPMRKLHVINVNQQMLPPGARLSERLKPELPAAQR